MSKWWFTGMFRLMKPEKFCTENTRTLKKTGLTLANGAEKNW